MPEIADKVSKTTAVVSASVYGAVASTPWAMIKTLTSGIKGAYKGSVYGSTGFLLGPAGIVTVPVGAMVGVFVGLTYGAGTNLADVSYTAYLGAKVAYRSDDSLKSGFRAVNNYAFYGIEPEPATIIFVTKKSSKEDELIEIKQPKSSINVPLSQRKDESRKLFLERDGQEKGIKKTKSLDDITSLIQQDDSMPFQKKTAVSTSTKEDSLELVNFSHEPINQANQSGRINMSELSVSNCVRIINEYRLSQPEKFKQFFGEALDTSFVGNVGWSTGYYNPLSSLTDRDQGYKNMKQFLLNGEVGKAFSALGEQGHWSVAGTVVGSDSFNTKVIDSLLHKILIDTNNEKLLKDYDKRPYFVKQNAKNIFIGINTNLRRERSSPDLPLLGADQDMKKVINSSSELGNGF
ncbi:hypothetical protein L3V82_01385 [Thiotrichales bacterium 19S3-7]|nr:hypothetical protein [Thiotrichales bacterium 19S3-7]MCF6800815.1 hypothetical protein [Thiotrichales bacterium 19S3-11]